MDSNRILPLLLTVFLANAGTPLSSLEPYVGHWRLEDTDRVRHLRWGLEQRVLHVETLAGDRLVSQGAFFWNPLKQQIEGRSVHTDAAMDFDASAVLVTPDGLQIDRVGVSTIGERLILREIWRIDATELVTEGRWLRGAGDNPAWRQTWRPTAHPDDG
ncbi:MAG: hypothetical protein AAGE01_21600 [Pseudomonadota bacterium]